MRNKLKIDAGGLPAWLFAEGWKFLAIYHALYILCWLANFSTPAAVAVFRFFHVVMLACFITLLIQRRKSITNQDWIFWIGIFLALLIPGAYLEYPADPWLHLHRILRWNLMPEVAHAEFRQRFGYFFAYSFLADIPVLWRRVVLDWYSTLTQFLLCFQVYLFSRKALELSPGWARLQVVGVLILFGTSLHSFRYYALAATPIAYVAYLAALRWLFDYTNKVKVSFLVPTVLCIIMRFNHPQEFFLFCIGTLAIAGTLLIPKRRATKYVVAALSILAFIWGAVHIQKHPELQQWFTRIGTLKIWKHSLRLTETYGVSGALAVVLAIVFFKKNRRLFVLALTPLAIYLFPPLITYLVRKASHPSDVYRLLYLIPLSIPLIYGLKQKLSLPVATGIVIGLGLIPFFPWRGRLYSQFVIPHPMHSLKFADVTAQWMKDHGLRDACWIVTDDVTSFALNTHLSHRLEKRNRLEPAGYALRIKSMADYKVMTQPFEVCGLLVPKLSEIPRIGPSFMARELNHWSLEVADIHALTAPEFTSWPEALLSRGWKKYDVPPFYTFYEPQSEAASLLESDSRD